MLYGKVNVIYVFNKSIHYQSCLLEVVNLPEVTESAYRAKERERDRYIDQKKQCEKRISSLESDLKEIKRAIKKMTAVQKDFKKEVKGISSLLDEKREFTGNQFNSLVTGGGGDLLSEAQHQQQAVNSTLDQLEWLRHNIQTKLDSEYGLLGRIKSSLDYAWTWLKTNYFNN